MSDIKLREWVAKYIPLNKSVKLVILLMLRIGMIYSISCVHKETGTQKLLKH